MIYTVTFNPALDYVMKLGSFMLGKTNRSFEEEIQIGGKGINVSLILSHLGIENTAMGFVAGFTGEELIRQSQKEGIKTDFIELNNGNTRINVKLKGEFETEINAAGPEIDENALKDFWNKISELSFGDTLVLSGSVPKSLPNNIYEQIMNCLQGKGIKICVDAGGSLLLNCLKYKPFVIKPNLDELEEIVGKKLENEESIISAAKMLKEKGAANVLISLGSDGAILLDESGKVHKVKAHKIKPINTVGAGDSMLAGFLAGYEKGYEYALNLGNAAGAATAANLSLAEKKQIEYYLNLALQ